MSLFGKKVLRPVMSIAVSRTDSPTPPTLREPGAETFVRIDTRDELARMWPGFKRVLRVEFDIGALITKLCPVEFENAEVAIFTVEEYAESEHIEEVEQMIRRQHRTLAHPCRVVVPATLLLSIAREQITGDTLKSRRRVLLDPLKSSMAAAFHDMVAWGIRHDASDLHVNVRMLESESEIKYTVGGKYVTPSRFQRMPTATLMEVLAVAYMDIQGGNGAVFDPAIEQQGRILHEVDGRACMLRWASLATDVGPSVTMRILRLDAQVRLGGFEALGYLPSQVAMLERVSLAEGGAVVLAGVVGSGKSTTIATMMAMVPATRKVITLEDPVEYLIPNALQSTVSRTLDGASAGAFDAKLKTIKRSAMNDLLIGEIRDQETGRAFMDLASSGSNLYTTTHAGSAMLIADRLASDFIGVSRDLLATPGILKLLVYQTLLPRLCPHCALPFASLFDERGASSPGEGAVIRSSDYWRRYADRIGSLYDIDTGCLRVCNRDGCVHCRTEHLPELTGLAGRTVVAEMIDPATDDLFLHLVRRSDALELREHFLSQRTSAYADPDMDGKTAMDCAIYKASTGLVDPRDIEPRFMSFETVELQRQNRSRHGRTGSSVRRRTNAVRALPGNSQPAGLRRVMG